MKFLEEKFVPLAAAIGSQKHLACIRDSFTTMMPLTIAGAVGVLFACIGALFDTTGLNMPAVMNGYNNFIASTGLQTVFGAMNAGTISMIAIIISGLLSYNLCAANGVEGAVGFAIGVACYLACLPAIDGTYFGAQGLFVAMISSLIVGTIFPKMALNPKLQISMPDGVPPAVAKAFSSLIPAIITLVIMCCGYTYLAKFTGMDAWTLVKTFISAPLSKLTQGVGMLIVSYFMIGLLWTFGLHGANIVGSVTSPILTPLGLENVALFAAGKEPIWTVSGGEQAAFCFLGGSGATIGAIIAIFLFSKSKASKSIATLATPPGIFEINEPLVFGLPIVMNVVYMFPFIFGPVILGIISYYLMELGMVRRCCISAPWVTPPILIGFLATGGDIRGAIWNVVAIVLLTVLWTPFIMMNDKLEAGQE